MSNTIFFRYANSLFELAKEAKKCDEIYNQLSVLCAIFENNNDIRKFFANFSVSKEEKFKLIERDFGTDFDVYIINFLKLLINKYRIQFLPKIFKEFKTLYNEYRNIKEVTVISAIKLTADEIIRIANIIQAKLNMVPESVRYKLGSTITKIVNKGSNNLIAIVL